MATDEAAEVVLVTHQRHHGGCLCGWAALGQSHPGHQVAMLREAALLKREGNMEEGSLADLLQANREREEKALAALWLMRDLSRCSHGNGEGVPCDGCPDGLSLGNPHLRPGDTVGYSSTGAPYVMPVDEYRQLDPRAWFVS